MDWANPALWVAIGGVITALGAVVAEVQHRTGPAHNPPPPSGGQS